MLATGLLYYLTRVWVSREVPADWDIATDIPGYKKGVRKVTDSYRPVSPNSAPGKIMKIILNAIEWYLKNNAIIKHTQHGLTREMFHVTNFMSFYCKVICPMDEGKAVDVVFPGF